jgi:hypothetical protein
MFGVDSVAAWVVVHDLLIPLVGCSSTLILHLKRFEFNLDAMVKIKLNDHCEFPLELDMEPFTVEGLAARELATNANGATDGGSGVVDEDVSATPPATATPSQSEEAVKHAREYYQYKLVGILVHRGVADSGHYYSFIKVCTCTPCDGRETHASVRLLAHTSLGSGSLSTW